MSYNTYINPDFLAQPHDQIILDDLAGLAVLDMRFLEPNPRYRYGVFYKDVCLNAYGNLYVAQRELWMTSPWIADRMDIVDRWQARKKKRKGKD